jgi:hypothetical protein
MKSFGSRKTIGSSRMLLNLFIARAINRARICPRWSIVHTISHHEEFA